MQDQCSTVQALLVIAQETAKAGQPQAAQNIYRRAIETAEITQGQDDPVTALALFFLTEFLSESGNDNEVRANRQRISYILAAYLATEDLCDRPTESDCRGACMVAHMP